MTYATPVFDKNVPIPRKGKAVYHDPRRTFLVGQEGFSLVYAFSCMEIGDSCLMSNWASPSVTYAQKKLGYKFTRQIQDDGTVRIWRTE